MGLGAKKGAEITLRAEGEDEDAAIEKNWCILTGESVKSGRIFKLKCILEKVFTAMKRDPSLMISGRSFYDDLYYFKIP